MRRLVFIIDDDLIQNEIHTILLKKIEGDYEVLSFKTSQEALAAIDNGQIPDLVFLDLHIPGEDESFFLRAHQSQNLSCDIFLMSSMSYLDNRSLSITFPAVKDFISKPLLDHKLRHVLNNYV